MNKQLITRNKWIPVLLILILLSFFTSLTLASNPFSEYFPGHDSSMFKYFGYAMKNGKTIYTEIFDHKGPIIFIWNYLGMLISSSNFEGIYLIELLSLFIYFLYTYKTSRLLLSETLSLSILLPQAISLTVFLEKGNLTEEFALPFIAYSLYVFSKYFLDKSKVINFEIVLLGISSAIVFLLRANMISIWIAFCFIITIDLIYSKRLKDLMKVILSFSLGMLVVFLPITIYLLINDAINAAIFQAFTFNFMYLGESSDKKEAIEVLFSHLNNHYVVLYFSLFLMQMIYKWRALSKKQKFLYTGAFLFIIISLYTSVMSGRSYKHYLMPIIPTMTLPLILLLSNFKKRIPILKIIILVSLITGLIYEPLLSELYDRIYITNIQEIRESEVISDRDQAVLNNKSQNDSLMQVSEIIKKYTKPNEKIYVHRQGGLLYLLSERLSSIKYFNLPSVDISENDLIGKDFISDITNSDTALIAISSGFYHHEKQETELEFFNFIISEYNLVYEGNGYYIYRYKT